MPRAPSMEKTTIIWLKIPKYISEKSENSSVDGEMDEHVMYKISHSWLQCRLAIWVSCDCHIPLRLTESLGIAHNMGTVIIIHLLLHIY